MKIKNSNTNQLLRFKRRWIIFSIILILLIAIITLYETRQELSKNTIDDNNAHVTHTEKMERASIALKKYYRYHDLPHGWEIGEINGNSALSKSEITVHMHFSPGIRSNRHGQPSDPGEINSHNGCPTPKGPWEAINTMVLRIIIHDKNGKVGNLVCLPYET